MNAYRRAVLVLGTVAVLAAAAAGLLAWVPATAVGAALLAGAYTGLGPPAAAVAGTVVAVATALTRVAPYDRAPSLVAAALCAVLLTVAARTPRRKELDAALVAAVGLAVVTASAADGRGPALPLAACVLLLVPALWHRQRASAGVAGGRPQPRVPRPLVAAVVGVTGLALLAVPVPAATGLHTSLFGGRGGSGSNQPDLDPAGYSTATLSLDVRGHLSDEPVLSVTADAPVLWRGAVYARYDGRSWQVPTGAPAPTPVAPRVAGRAPSAVTVTPAGLDPVPAGPVATVTAVPAGTYDGTLYAPGVVTALRSTAQLRPDAPGTAHLEAPVSYAVTVHEAVTDPARLAAARGADPAGWTQLPELPARVRTLATQITAATPSRSAAVAAIEAYLRAHERYTLAAPVPAAGRDSVDAFLFGSHEGFCEQFASAEVVLLRSVGVPARLATGLASGQSDGRGSRLFTQADAHAWVEVAYPGLGWSPSDPTAGSQLVAARSGLLDRIRGFAARLGRTPLLRAATAAGLAVALLAGVGGWLLGRRGLLARRRRATLAPVTAAFSRLQRRVPRPAGATPREWLRTLPEELAPAVGSWERELFAATPPDPAEVMRSVALVDAARRRARRSRGHGGMSCRAGRPWSPDPGSSSRTVNKGVRDGDAGRTDGERRGTSSPER